MGHGGYASVERYPAYSAVVYDVTDEYRGEDSPFLSDDLNGRGRREVGGSWRPTPGESMPGPLTRATAS
jgi:hypothetical protein